MRSPRGLTRVQILGYYGMANFGDELFVDTAKRCESQLWPLARVRSFAPQESSVYRQLGLAGQFSRLCYGLAGGVWADRFSLFGGSVLTDVNGMDALRVNLFRGKPYEALGVSIGPFASDVAADRVRALLARVDRIVVRDAQSIGVWSQLAPGGCPPSLGGDLAALNPTIVSASRRHQGEVTICPSSAAQRSKSRLLRSVVGGLAVLDGPVSVRLLSLSSNPTHGDEETCHWLAPHIARLGYAVRVDTFAALGVQGTIQAIAASEMVWTERFHGAVVAYLCEVPFLVVGHHSKCRAFAGDVGLPGEFLVGAGETWETAISAMLRGAPTAPSVGPEEYRARAHGAYLGKSFSL